ncbi:hypothetical protein QBC36DRAFT_368611 [Triangularia setosa]|uniref:Uncharacterized protein n=1 Tax=Triangularia setosa TaxID=2587417 RepID=A0AAN7A9S9_9PEZI|nr:hypothetical protein QBC36DRAFT_368611 [Podospora setosa]
MAAKSAIPKNLISSPFLGELLSSRSIYIKVRPAPQNLSQRRAILKVLKQHGKIEVFKALGEPHSFISVTSDSATAQNLILKAPLELSYGTSSPAAEDAPPPSESQAEEGQKFFIDIFEASTHQHKRFASKHSPLAGPWKTGSNITAWPNDISLAATIPGLTDKSPANDNKGEPHEAEDLLKSASRRHLEQSYRDKWVDLGWKGMTDWEGCDQVRETYREDGETFEGGFRDGLLRKRWNGRQKGGLVMGGGKKRGEEKEAGVNGKVRWVIGGGKGEVNVEIKDEKVGTGGEGRRWRVKERSGLVLGKE